MTHFDFFTEVISKRSHIFEVLKDIDGWVMIDRSGKHFGTILNFLRDGNVPLPECRVETLEILAEAKYYLIQVWRIFWLKYIFRSSLNV